MDIDPADAPTVQFAAAYEIHNFGMWNRTQLVYLFIAGKKSVPASYIADKEFAVNQFVPGNFVESQQPV